MTRKYDHHLVYLVAIQKPIATRERRKSPRQDEGAWRISRIEALAYGSVNLALSSLYTTLALQQGSLSHLLCSRLPRPELNPKPTLFTLSSKPKTL